MFMTPAKTQAFNISSTWCFKARCSDPEPTISWVHAYLNWSSYLPYGRECVFGFAYIQAAIATFARSGSASATKIKWRFSRVFHRTLESFNLRTVLPVTWLSVIGGPSTILPEFEHTLLGTTFVLKSHYGVRFTLLASQLQVPPTHRLGWLFTLHGNLAYGKTTMQTRQVLRPVHFEGSNSKEPRARSMGHCVLPLEARNN